MKKSYLAGAVFALAFLMPKAVELNYTQMQSVYDAVRSSQMQDYAWYETKKASIEACLTVTELEAIEWI